MDRRSDDDETPDGALSPQPPEAPRKPALRRYHVPLTPKEVLERLAEQPGVKAY